MLGLATRAYLCWAVSYSQDQLLFQIRTIRCVSYSQDQVPNEKTNYTGSKDHSPH